MPTRHRLSGHWAGLCLLAIALTGCSPAEKNADIDGGLSEIKGNLPGLEISPDSYDFSRNPKLLQRIVATPHGYFRFINKPFSQAVCAHFKDDLVLIPNVNLHGDAHLEQYAVTDMGRGLDDFDDASIGPAIIDLARFGVSVHLACRANGWAGQEETIIRAVLRGYRAALKDPELDRPPPPLVRRMRASFDTDHATAMAQAEALMEPVEMAAEDFAAINRRYQEQMHAIRPDLPATFFQIKRYGRLKLGVGSALDEKYLTRVEGPTAAPGDDLVLEIKEVRDLSGIGCIPPTKIGDPFRILIGQARIAYRPYKLIGFVVAHPRKGDSRQRSFWVREWADNYRELSVEKSFASPDDLRAIAHDVGIQLGLGHPKEIADPHALQLRRALLAAVDEFEEDLLRTARDLDRMTIAAWKQFRTEAGSPER